MFPRCLRSLQTTFSQSFYQPAVLDYAISKNDS